MKKTLEDNNYIVIRNFISKDRALNLFLEYANYCKNNDVEGDSQCPNCFGTYDCIPFLELLCEKTPVISHVIEETVLPTFTYTRLHKNGSILKKHSDREACEITLTLHLHGDQSWPIWIETPSGEEVSVNLESGDAMLYLGKKAPHWSCLLYTSPSPRDQRGSRMPSSA